MQSIYSALPPKESSRSLTCMHSIVSSLNSKEGFSIISPYTYLAIFNSRAFNNHHSLVVIMEMNTSTLGCWLVGSWRWKDQGGKSTCFGSIWRKGISQRAHWRSDAEDGRKIRTFLHEVRLNDKSQSEMDIGGKGGSWLVSNEMGLSHCEIIGTVRRPVYDLYELGNGFRDPLKLRSILGNKIEMITK